MRVAISWALLRALQLFAHARRTMVQQTDPRNVYKIVLSPQANQPTRFTFQPTFVGPVVCFLASVYTSQR